MKAVVHEGCLDVEAGGEWSERFVRLMPGSIAFWDLIERPVAGAPPVRLYLLEDLDVRFDEVTELSAASETIRLRCRDEWTHELKVQMEMVEARREAPVTRRFLRRQGSDPMLNRRRSTSVPPLVNAEKVEGAEERASEPKVPDPAASTWHDFVAAQARQALERAEEPTRAQEPLPKSSRNTKFVLIFESKALGFSLEIVRGEMNRLVVKRVKDGCEHVDKLCPGDELVSVNGALVPDGFAEEAFVPLMERLTAAPRPLRLGFDSPRDLETRHDLDKKPPPPPPAILPESPPDDDITVFKLTFTTEKLGFVLARDPSRSRPVISRVRDNCQHKRQLRVRDELLAVGGADVPRPITDEAFAGLLKIIKASKRPLTLTVQRRNQKLRRAHTTVQDDVKSRDRSATAVVGDDDTVDPERNWHEFIRRHAQATNVAGSRQ